jgi:hypothetical protein
MSTSVLRLWIVACLLSSALVTAGIGFGNAGGPRVPVVACPTHESLNLAGALSEKGSSGVVRPQSLPLYSNVPTGLQRRDVAHLARYVGDLKHASDMNILAPRGWKCSAYIPEDGSWYMTVAPAVAHPHARIRVIYRWGYQAMSFACDYFPAVQKVYDHPALCKPPHGAKITVKNQHLATVATSLRSRSVPQRIGYILWYTGLPHSGNETRLVDCVIDGADRTLCAPILLEARIRQQRALDARSSRK